jgi:periplasmic divalent cation tolerance protein
MEKPEYIIIMITSRDAEEADQIAELILEQRLAACINVIPGVNSSFWWEGEIKKAQESLLIVKTGADQLPEIIQSVKAVHSNSVPEIIVLPIIGGNLDYLDWIENELSETGELD